MDTIFENVFTSENKRTPSEIQVWMESIRDSRKTGVVWLYGPPNEKIILHIDRGNWLNSDLLTDEGGINVSKDMFAKFIPLTMHGLIHSNLLMQAELQQRRNEFGASEYPWESQSSDAGTDPYLIKLKWRNASGSVLFNGVSNLPHSLFFTDDLILDEAGISTPIFQRRNDPSCIVTVFSPDPSLDAWQELRLRQLFKSLCDHMLERFELLAGRAIVDTFAQVIVTFTVSHNLDISIIKRQLTNHEFFPTSQAAAQNYKLILNELTEHFYALVGPRLLTSNLRDITSSLSPENQRLLKTYAILPDEYFL